MKRLYKYHILSLVVFFLFVAMGVANFSAHAQQKKNNEKSTTITNQEKTLTIYPVPVTTTVHIRISQALRPDIEKLEIYSLIGRKLTEQSIIDPNTTEDRKSVV